MKSVLASPWPNTFCVEAADVASLSAALGSRGLNLSEEFNSRTERHQTNDGLEEEIYLLRRYLFTLESRGLLKYPLKICKRESPDFICSFVSQEHGIEVTQATSTCDQRELTLSEDDPELSMAGAHGGRYAGGVDGNRPERDVVADVIRAVRRKAAKVRKVKYHPLPRLELLIYANSNASWLCHEQRALKLLKQKIDKWMPKLLRGTNIDHVAVMLGSKLATYNANGFDVIPLRSKL